MNNVDKYKAFAQDIVATVKKHDARVIDLTFTIGWDGPFERARMTYSAGRHGSPGTLNLIVTTHIGDFEEEGTRDDK